MKKQGKKRKAAARKAGRSNQVFRHSEDLMFRANNDELTIVIDTKDSRFFKLNATAGLIWSLLDGEHSLAQISERLSEEFWGRKILGDLEKFVTRLEKQGLVFASGKTVLLTPQLPPPKKSGKGAQQSKKWRAPEAKQHSEEYLFGIAAGGGGDGSAGGDGGY